ncbi:transcriptional repressor, CopY family [Alkaliphilus metalliredigens QYMF]|uniref:Transcriptional repressor, CopY family n=1 Tax=Alkaliphilus metalliredigens (strain QYMF) TaxID=293826 RepID=A6TUY1_ALKMQ|nr:BlaI/MecI/CopY family transcriptional regulator [Alkaliphilus metalliredigens]ABR49999.1 transcriptional repressor, CopY family [Alkaliphilus metalliredigens QYMF]
MSKNLKLFDAEYRFTCIVWDNEPIQSRKLANICEQQLGWKRTTTYTVLRKLCERGIMQNNNSIVTTLVTKEDVYQYESNSMIERTFGGSLPSFITAFLKDKKLSKEEVNKIKNLIDEYKEE